MRYGGKRVESLVLTQQLVKNGIGKSREASLVMEGSREVMVVEVIFLRTR